MSALPPKDAVVRLQGNESNFDQFLNANALVAYISSITGQSVESIPHFLNRLDGEINARYGAAYTNKGNWTTATAYSINDLVTQGGVVYSAVVAHTSSAAFSTDLNSGKWAVYQGIVQDTLDKEFGPTLYGLGGRAGLGNDASSFLTALLSLTTKPNISPGDWNTPNLSYLNGIDWQGIGRLFKAIAGGNLQLSSDADQNKHIFGLEYMAAFHNRLIEQSETPSRRLKIGFAGDSTTEGASVPADYVPSTLFNILMTVNSVQSPAGTDVYNIGHSGWNTKQWGDSSGPGGSGANYGLQKALSLTLDAIIVALGINDPGWQQDGSPSPADAGQNYPGRRNIVDFTNSMRAILTALRTDSTTGRPVSALTIVLAVPNSTSDTPNGRDEQWYEQIRPVLKRLAREFQCVFVDKYALFRDSRSGAAGGYMDDIVSPGSGRAVHPLRVMNLWIAEVYHNIFYPQAVKAKLGKGALQVICGLEDTGDGNRLLTSYRPGLTIGRALNNYPSTGNVITFRSGDDTGMQFFFPFTGAERYYFQFRLGTSADLGDGTTWGPWQLVGGTSVNIAPAGGWSAGAGGNGAMRVANYGDSFVIEGFLTLNSPSIASTGSVVGTLPAGARPVREPIYGANFTILRTSDNAKEYLRGDIGTDGVLTLRQTSTIVCNRLYVNAAFSRRP